jgi:hypothetical protein
MKSLTRTTAAVLTTIAFASGSAAMQGQEPDLAGVPRQVSAKRTGDGITIVSADPRNPFSIALAGKEIKPVSKDRLVLRIDGKEVEVFAMPMAPEVSKESSEKQLADFRSWLLARWEPDQWRAMAANGEQITSPTGEKGVLFAAEREALGANRRYRLVAATPNASNIVALIGSSDDSAGLASLKSYLRNALLSLKPGKATSAPAPQEPAETGPEVTLAEGLRIWQLFGGESRALVNEKLMTKRDSQLADAVPVSPATLLQCLRFAVRADVLLMNCIVFDGRSAHVINVQSYDAASNSFSYWDPWGKGSFLAVESNVAGVRATPDPKEERMWIIKADQLEKVFYALTIPFDIAIELSSEVALGSFGSLGDNLIHAEKTDLFTFFHLEHTAKAKNDKGHEVITFKPTGPKFRPLVSLDITTDGKGRLRALDLTLQRSFIEDPEIGVFARDIAKSLIRQATMPRDRGRIDDLANQIELDVRGQTTLVLRGPTSVRLPDQPTKDYLAFLGKEEAFTRALALSRLTLTNRKNGDEPALVISLETTR